MSFEGYYQVICQNDHYHEVGEIYDRPFDPQTEPEFVCPHCGAAPLWINRVNNTNCDERGKVNIEIDRPEQRVGDELLPAIVKLPSRQNGELRDEQWFE